MQKITLRRTTSISNSNIFEKFKLKENDTRVFLITNTNDANKSIQLIETFSRKMKRNKEYNKGIDFY